MKNPPDIFAAVAKASAFHGLPVLVIGGQAVNAYGYTRTTIDADFLIAVDSLSSWQSILEK